MRHPAFLALIVLCGSTSLAQAEDLVVGGSTTVQPIMVAICKAYQDQHPDIHITVGAGGSENGIDHTASGKFAIGMSSRPLNDKDRTAFPELVDNRIGSDGLVLIAPTAVTATALTSAQVVAIYTGAVTNWKQVGGNDLAIVPIGRDQAHGSAKVFDAFFKLEPTEEFLGAAPMIHERVAGSATPGSVVVQVTANNDESIAMTLSREGSLAYCSASAAEGVIAKGAPIHILSLDGVIGSTATIRDGTYPLQRPLLLLTKGKPTGTVKDVIDFALSPAGQKIVATAEFIPVAGTASP
jgi:phosphate transport system substrate-binding protein